MFNSLSNPDNATFLLVLVLTLIACIEYVVICIYRDRFVYALSQIQKLQTDNRILNQNNRLLAADNLKLIEHIEQTDAVQNLSNPTRSRKYE